MNFNKGPPLKESREEDGVFFLDACGDYGMFLVLGPWFFSVCRTEEGTSKRWVGTDHSKVGRADTYAHDHRTVTLKKSWFLLKLGVPVVRSR